jgi:predicted ribosomally synthesized peptide with SipW-like signal peptide
MSDDPIPPARVHELLAAEQQKRRNVQLMLAAAVALLLLGGGAFAWWADKQAAALRVERERAEQLAAEARAQAEQLRAREQEEQTARELAEQVRKELERQFQAAITQAEVEDGLQKAAELRKKIRAFAEPREPGPAEVAPAPRAIGP